MWLTVYLKVPVLKMHELVYLQMSLDFFKLPEADNNHIKRLEEPSEIKKITIYFSMIL